MMLFFVPAWIDPTVTTPTPRGSTSREAMVCRRITVAAAITTGSIVVCGREPVTAAAVQGDRDPVSGCHLRARAHAHNAGGQGSDVLAEDDIRFRVAVEDAGIQHRP